MPPLQHDDVTAWGLEILGQSAGESRHALPLMAGEVRAGFAEGAAAWERGDYATALREFLAEQGDARAQSRLGELFEAGRGVAKSYPDAQIWNRKAAEQGLARAQYTLARLHWFGRGSKKSYPEAAKWYRKAAEQNYAKAQSSLGYMYFNGQGLKKSSADAAIWYRKGANLGNPVAQSRLGTLMAAGNGVAKDPVEAYFWMTLAIKRSSGNLKKNITTERARLAKTMTPAQTLSAGRRAAGWSVKTPK